MKKILSLTFLLFCITITLQSQTVVGTPAGVAGAMFRNNLSRAFTSVTDMGLLRAKMKTELEKAREEYWAASPNVSNDSPLATNYYYWLTARDVHTINIALANYIEHTIDPNKWSNTSLDVRGTADLLISFVGGKQNDMIEPFARDTYKEWEESVITYWKDKGVGIFDGKTLVKAYEDNATLYDAHFNKVWLAEYLFHNANSPLKSDNSKEVLKHILLIADNPGEIEKDTYLQELTTYAGDEAITKGVQEWRNDYGQGEIWLHNLSKDARGNGFFRMLEWFIIKNSKPKVYALYSIKRRFLVSWQEAENILQNRVNRYGKEKVEMAVQRIWENRANRKYRCIGDPFDNRNERRLNEIGLDWYSIKSNEDCLCAELGGNSVLWYDLYDRMTTHNLEDLKSDFLKRNEISSQEFTKLESVLSPQLLLFAEYLEHKYGDVIYMADEIGTLNYKLLASIPDTDRPGKTSAIFRIMDGLASLENHAETQLVVASWKYNLSKTSWELAKQESLMEALNKAFGTANALYANYGKESVLKQVVKSANQTPPDPFTNIFTLKSRWIGQVDRLMSELTPGVDAGLLAEYADQYKDLFKNRSLIYTIQDKKWEGTQYRHGVLFESEKVKIMFHVNSILVFWDKGKDENYKVCDDLEFNAMLTHLLHPLLEAFNLSQGWEKDYIGINISLKDTYSYKYNEISKEEFEDYYTKNKNDRAEYFQWMKGGGLPSPLFLCESMLLAYDENSKLYSLKAWGSSGCYCKSLKEKRADKGDW